jgi:hypothetical protein
MPFLETKNLGFDVDAVLRGQGADPVIIRKRSPRIVEAAERALEEGGALLEPLTLYRQLDVTELRHEQLVLEKGLKLTGKLVSTHLGSAKCVVLILCTVGEALETYASDVSGNDIVYGLALDGVGSAAVEALANTACNHFDRQANEQGLQSSIPISPGMVGWTVEKGQPEVFSILEPEQVNVNLSEYGLIKPRKSLTMVMGFGPKMNAAGRTCDFCAMRETCQYQDHYEPVQTKN